MTPLRQRMLEDLQVRNLSPLTQRAYLEQVSRFARHFAQSPERLGPEAIRAYQVYLTTEKQLAPSFIAVAVAALRFLYTVTLQQPWGLREAAVRGPRPGPRLRRALHASRRHRQPTTDRRPRWPGTLPLHRLSCDAPPQDDDARRVGIHTAVLTSRLAVWISPHSGLRPPRPSAPRCAPGPLSSPARDAAAPADRRRHPAAPRLSRPLRDRDGALAP